MSEKAKAEGSILKLVANKWKTVGVGELVLIYNKHNPTEVLLKVIRKEKNDSIMFQCPPKAKPNGKSLILKGISTKKNKEFVLAVRFAQNDGMIKFKKELEKVQRWTQKITKMQKKRTSKPPKELRQELAKFAWDCELCRFRNEPTTFDCTVCNSPRPLKKREPLNIDTLMDPPKHHHDNQSIQIKDLPPIMTPKNTNGTEKFPNTRTREVEVIHEDEMVFIEEDDYKKETKLKNNFSSNSSEEISKQPSLKKSTDKRSVEEQEEEEKKSTIKELILNVTAGKESYNLQTRTIE
eukprot:204622_1